MRRGNLLSFGRDLGLVQFTSSPSQIQNQMSQQISLFRSQITNRRFDGGTLGILEMLLISKDVRSSIEVRSSLKQFMRTESLCVLREIAHTTLEQKLSVLDFFVKAFALIGDFEARFLNPSCLLL
ncbi:hypothetical protein CRG98_013022 [Punica granatum]|uniref:Uncharacterized protein n=1 Tax=Punica granatum TaxID=22663 RepID=A0A2I0KDI0_PUNGR|nr:hypothetical protein CRG98_013022 [Punica granatum]